MFNRFKLIWRNLAGFGMALDHLHEQAKGHVEDMIDIFAKRGTTNLEIYASRWRGIANPPLWPAIQKAALRLYPTAVHTGKVQSEVLVVSRQFGRVVRVSVAPSRGDDHLLASFPEADYGKLLQNVRKEFRKLADWESRDFVHWMFLWDAGGLDVHLLYLWSIRQVLINLGKALERTNSRTVNLPIIFPKDLVSETEFVVIMDKLIREEVLYLDERHK